MERVERYRIQFCEGQAPFLCVTRDGRQLGVIELLTTPGGASALRAGNVVEKVMGVGAAEGDDLHLLVPNAPADEGCLARESELPVDAGDDLAPVLEALAAGTTRFPTAAGAIVYE